jgi:hypothetical protein
VSEAPSGGFDSRRFQYRVHPCRLLHDGIDTLPQVLPP